MDCAFAVLPTFCYEDLSGLMVSQCTEFSLNHLSGTAVLLAEFHDSSSVSSEASLLIRTLIRS